MSNQDQPTTGRDMKETFIFDAKDAATPPASPTAPTAPSSPSAPSSPPTTDPAPLPALESVVPSKTQSAILHTLEAAGLVAISFILQAVIGGIGHWDTSHWTPAAQLLWTYALPTIVLGIQSALKIVEAQKQTVLATKTIQEAKSFMKSMKSSGGVSTP